MAGQEEKTSSGGAQRPQYGELDPEIAKRQAADPGPDRVARNAYPDFASPVQRFPGVSPASRPVPAGRQVGFELLGQMLFSMLLGFNISFFGALMFPDYFSESNRLAVAMIETESLSYAVEYLEHQLPHAIVSLAISTLFFAFLLTVAGKTPGGILGRYRMVDVKDGEPLKFSKALSYYAAYTVLGFTVIVSLLIWLSPFFDSASGWHRGWLYRTFGTIAVDARERRR